MLIDNITIDYKFRPYPEVEIRHLNENYCGQLVLLNFYIIDEKTNQPVKISGQHWRVSFAANEAMYSIYAKWYVEVKMWNPDYGFIVVDSHTYNDCGKDVLISLHSKDYDDIYTWMLVGLKYKEIHRCNVHFSVEDETISKKLQAEFGIFPVPWDNRKPYGKNSPYAKFDIGRFDPHRNTNHYMYELDGDKETKILNPYPDAYPSGVRLVTGNMMFSYKNPRDWTNLTTEQVAEDILGLSQDWSIV